MTAQEYLNGLAAYRDTFWPEFVQHDDCIFLALNPTYYPIDEANGPIAK
jgi:hypothetical protein